MIARMLLWIAAIAVVLAGSSSTASPVVGPHRFVMNFEGTVGDLSLLVYNSGRVNPAVHDPYGLLGGRIVAGDPVTIRISTPILVPGDLGLPDAGPATFSLAIGEFRWTTPMSLSAISIFEGYSVESVSMRAGSSSPEISPFPNAPTLDAYVAFARHADPRLITANPFELPDPADYEGSGLILIGDGLLPLQQFRLSAQITSATAAPIPEPTAAFVFAIGIGCVSHAFRNRSRVS